MFHVLPPVIVCLATSFVPSAGLRPSDLRTEESDLRTEDLWINQIKLREQFSALGMPQKLLCNMTELQQQYQFEENSHGLMPTLVAVAGSSERNLCLGERLLPEVLFIGAAKAASSSFADHIASSPAILRPTAPDNGKQAKEGHFFITNKTISAWYPACNRTNRLVGLDPTPRYMIDPCVPSRVARFYGDAKTSLTFIVILREPLARLQSDFYHSQSAGWCDRQAHMNFSGFVTELLTTGYKEYVGGYDLCSDRLEASLYADQLLRWFAEFNPTQFIVVPYQLYVNPSRYGRSLGGAPELVWRKLGIPGGGIGEPPHENSHQHPSLEVDLDIGQASRARRLIADLGGSPASVSAVLTEVAPGATLYGFPGPSPPSRGAVTAWLMESW